MQTQTLHMWKHTNTAHFNTIFYKFITTQVRWRSCKYSKYSKQYKYNVHCRKMYKYSKCSKQYKYNVQWRRRSCKYSKQYKYSAQWRRGRCKYSKQYKYNVQWRMRRCKYRMSCQHQVSKPLIIRHQCSKCSGHRHCLRIMTMTLIIISVSEDISCTVMIEIDKCCL